MSGVTANTADRIENRAGEAPVATRVVLVPARVMLIVARES
jgi:hypothetical protein